MGAIPPAAVEAAAKWWRNVVENPKFDNGDKNPAMAGLAMMLAERTIPVETLDKFEENLRQALTNTSPSFDGRVTLLVDYNPDEILRACWPDKALGSDVGVFPWKTHMRISPTEVYVRHGYGADRQVIWKAVA